LKWEPLLLESRSTAATATRSTNASTFRWPTASSFPS
jgi:hypothetical protein